MCVALVLAGAPLWLPAAAQAREVHLQLHGLSVHAKERRMRDGQPYNGESWGVGLCLQTSGAVALQAGLYRNSFDRWSRYATCDWTPFPAFGTNMGVFAAITHNDPYNDGGLMPASGFLARWSGKGSSVIVRLVPPIYEVNGSIAMEIGMRL